MNVATHGGEVVYSGLTQEQKDYACGWNDARDDVLEGLPRDSTLAAEVSWYAAGYRDGYEAETRFTCSNVSGETLLH